MAAETPKALAVFVKHRWDIVRIVLGLLLLATAGLKLAGMQVSPIPRVGTFAALPVQMIAAEWELVLGVWLLSGAYRVASWLFSTATFAIFACISGYMGWIGQADCGCFGTIKASPWYAFGVDVTVLSLLAPALPHTAILWQPSRCHNRASIVRGIAFLALIGGLTAIALIGGTFAFGSSEAALAHLRGDGLVIEPTVLDLGSVEKGQVVKTTITVKNWTNRRVRLVGGTSDCSCLATLGLPADIEPGAQMSIPIVVVVKAMNSGELSRWALLWVDSEEQPTLPFGVTFRVH